MAHYCHFWYKLGGCTCNTWVLGSRVQVTRGNKFERVRVPLLDLKYSQVRVRVNLRGPSCFALSSRLVGGGGGQMEAEPTKRPKRRACVVWLLSVKWRSIIKKNAPRAQTTPDASFAPCFL